MLNNVVSFYFGYAQIHASGYWEEQTIDRSIELIPDQLASWEKSIGGYKLRPRLESFALASTGPATMGVMISGVDPAGEDQLTKLSSRLVKGSYFSNGKDEILLSEGIATELNLGVGDTMVLLSQGYHGVTAASKYPISGILRFGSPDLNKMLVFMPLPTAQDFFGAENRATSLVIELQSTNQVPGVLKILRKQLDPAEFEIMGWEELIPDLVQARAMDDAGNVIMLLILYIIIAFGLLGTVLMMVREREYEFGVLVAIGMHRIQLFGIVWAEILFLSAVGAIIGMVLAMPVVWYFHVNPIVFTGEMAAAYEKFGVEPIIPTVVELRIFLNQALVIFSLATFMAFYPLFKIMKLSPIQSMRH